MDRGDAGKESARDNKRKKLGDKIDLKGNLFCVTPGSAVINDFLQESAVV